MRLFGITKSGLFALTAVVCALWLCVGMERSTTRRAERDLRASLRKIQSLREDVTPVSRPVDIAPHGVPSAA
ncbi:MAG TPA: hypothetical protein VHB50_04235 [Bryobacteraceae bacterium]|nr:hypothetical protein [Bryobacteraceae bacterium]